MAGVRRSLRLVACGAGARVGLPCSSSAPDFFRDRFCSRLRSSSDIDCSRLGCGQGRRDSNPRPSVLETDALPTELLPSEGRLVTLPATQRGLPGANRSYLVSLCVVWRRSCEQYFFISSRSRSLTLDFIVM